MSCSKNIKRFLFFKYEGPHHAVETRIKAIFNSSYEVRRACAICECELESEYLPEVAMPKRGYDIKKLQSMCRHSVFSTDADDLK